jgi:hypothetical protein
MRIDPKYTHRCSAPIRSIPAATTVAVSAWELQMVRITRQWQGVAGGGGIRDRTSDGYGDEWERGKEGAGLKNLARQQLDGGYRSSSVGREKPVILSP